MGGDMPRRLAAADAVMEAALETHRRHHKWQAECTCWICVPVREYLEAMQEADRL